MGFYELWDETKNQINTARHPLNIISPEKEQSRVVCSCQLEAKIMFIIYAICFGETHAYIPYRIPDEMRAYLNRTC